jgi:hypothetical protein
MVCHADTITGSYSQKNTTPFSPGMMFRIMAEKSMHLARIQGVAMVLQGDGLCNSAGSFRDVWVTTALTFRPYMSPEVLELMVLLLFPAPGPALIASGCQKQNEYYPRNKGTAAIQKKFKIRMVILSSAVQVD